MSCCAWWGVLYYGNTHWPVIWANSAPELCWSRLPGNAAARKKETHKSEIGKLLVMWEFWL